MKAKGIRLDKGVFFWYIFFFFYCGHLPLMPADWKFQWDSKFIFHKRMVAEKNANFYVSLANLFLDTKTTLLGFQYAIIFLFKLDTR